MPQVRIDKGSNLAVEHSLHARGLVRGAQVLDHLVGCKDVGAYLRAPLGLDEVAADLREVLDTLLPDEIAEVVAEALFEHESTEAARALLDECVHDIAAQLVLATVPDVSKKVSEEHVTHDRDAVVACAAHVVMGGSCLRQLAHVLGDRASSAMLTSQLKDLARRQAAARLLATAHEAARPREELQETLPLGRLQRALTLRAGLGSLLRLLRGDESASGGALDAEEQAIDERERVLIMERARRRERAALR